MQLGIRLHDIKKAPLDERLMIAHEQGFKCGHLALAKVIDEFPTDNGALTPGLAMHLKKLFAKNDIDIAVLGCYLNLTDPNEERMKKTYERYFANIRFNQVLGAGVMGTETGSVNEEYKFEERNHSDEALKLFIERVKPVIRCAENFGVIFAIEPVFKHIVYDPKRARKALDEIGSQNLRIIFDPVNLLDITNYERRDEILEEAIELLGDDIAMLHLKDFVVENGQLKSVACGTGEMKYDRIMKFVKERKPFMHATLENTVPENAETARKFIQEIYDRV